MAIEPMDLDDDDRTNNPVIEPGGKRDMGHMAANPLCELFRSAYEMLSGNNCNRGY